jgi:hypothetical protein
MSRVLWYGALAGCLLSACDDGTLRAFEPLSGLDAPGASGRDGTASTGAFVATAGTASAAGAASAAGSSESGGTTGGDGSGGAAAGTDAGGDAGKTSSPLLIDDFEDGDTIAQAPLGWWYPINDGTGTQGFGIEPVSRGTASVYALRTHGSGFKNWGAAVGVDLTGGSPSLNALGYRQLCFAARIEAGSSSVIQVHLLQGKLHYIQELSLSETWTRYCRPFGDFVTSAQEPLVPSELLSLQFFFAPGSPFEFWLDDIEFTP